MPTRMLVALTGRLRGMKLEGTWSCRRIIPPQPHSTTVSIYPHSIPATARRFLNIFSIFSGEAREKERLRLQDEMNRGYFDDIKDLKKQGGKIFVASPKLSSKASASKFPTLLVRSTDGHTATIPFGTESLSEKETPRAVLVCIAFRATAKNMIDSWTVPFLAAFKSTPDVRLFEVSWIDSWFLSLPPVQGLLLQSMRKQVGVESEQIRRQVMYTFGDSYGVRKILGLKNRLSGYVFLVDKEGCIRWQASGMATPEELDFMVLCTSLLLKENQ